MVSPIHYFLQCCLKFFKDLAISFPAVSISDKDKENKDIADLLTTLHSETAIDPTQSRRLSSILLILPTYQQ